MAFVVIPIVALLASLLTFFSGFGLGTILLPAFAIFFPVNIAVALTAIVHLLNTIFKFGLVGRNTAFLNQSAQTIWTLSTGSISHWLLNVPRMPHSQ